ncbi:MAG: SUMF1/EgtB/PvdO family nonheme iron enzyme, partial [Myxococcales bacterium]|nr:SUMF1/EgtB/PvdO family nonheme iron enzyme [Myxococcales bacterium]
MRATFREQCAALYPTSAQARMVADEAGIATGRVRFDHGADVFWAEIINEAAEQGPAALNRLKLYVHREFPDVVPAPPPTAVTDAPEGPLAAWLDEQWRLLRRVKILGFQRQERVHLTLDEVFVELRTRVGFWGPACAEKMRFGPEVDGHMRDAHVELPGALALMVEAGKRGLILIGDPGAGKTTLLKHLFCRVRAEGSAAVGLPPDLQPVFLRFADLTEADRRSDGLAAFVRRVAGKRHGDAAEDLIGGRQLFLLDGLDEVRDAATRAAVCRWLEEEVHRWPQACFVASCRYAAWRGESRLANDFLPAEVEWLSEERVREYVPRWYRAVYLGLMVRPEKAEEAQERAAALLDALLDPERQVVYGLRQMTQNPMLLSLLCLVHYAGDALPERRVGLYHECVGFLLKTWAQEKGHAGLPVDQARLVLQPLAWAMHRQQAAGDGPKDRPMTFTGAEARAVVEGPLAGMPQLQLDAQDFLDTAREVCGVLSGTDVDTYEFPHLSFQEYLAASHAADEHLYDALVDGMGDAFWREAILLAFSMPGVFKPLMQAVVRRGEVAAHLDLLNEGFRLAPMVDPAPFLPALRRPRGWRAWFGRGPDLREVAAIFSLFRNRPLPTITAAAEAWADHPAVAAPVGIEAHRPGRFLRPAGSPVGIEWVEIAPGAFWMGSSNEKGHPVHDPEAWDNELPPFRLEMPTAYRIARHPTTNADYGVFVKATGREPPAEWSNSRFNAPKQPVVGVNWADARAFCDWLNTTAAVPAGWRADLPTEAEWEYAARGGDGRRYPWGDALPEAERANFGGQGLELVGRHPLGRSPWGVEEMAGTVWEWCL